MARSSGTHTVTTLSSVAADKVDIAAPWDALARPESDDLIRASVALLPQGAAWGSPDGEAISLDSWHARFVRVLLHPFLALYTRLWLLVREGAASQSDLLLDLWEADYGLPDACTAGNGSKAERLRALSAKVASIAVSTPGDFILLASQYGFTITITEPCLFECGFSECGGEHETGNPRPEETYWEVSIVDGAVDYFTCGESELGHDRLFDLGESALLLCMLRRLAPGWTLPILV